MVQSRPITPIGPFRASLRLPGSKSLTNRALLMAALADGTSQIRDPLWADDTHCMVRALDQLGFEPSVLAGGRLVTVRGRGGSIPAASADLDLGNAGTAMRPLTAVCCLGSGSYRLDGNPRMRQRPIGELVEPLGQLGAQIGYLGEAGYPPLLIEPGRLLGGSVSMATTQSSQFITALLMVGPCCRKGLALKLEGHLTSRPYVQMTVAMMGRFGIRVQVDPRWDALQVGPGLYRPVDHTVEPDATSATYFLAAAAICPQSSCTIENLGTRSCQGDVGFGEVLGRMGAAVALKPDSITVTAPQGGRLLRGIDEDLNHMPDAAMTLAAIAPLCDGPTTIRNVQNLRVKETDRLAALANELTRVGATVAIDGGDLRIEPPAARRVRPAVIRTYDDHRMAMSFAVLGLRVPGIVIRDPECVNKTFPQFFRYLDRLGPPS